MKSSAIRQAVENALNLAKPKRWGFFARERIISDFSYQTFFSSWKNLFQLSLSIEKEGVKN
jgi:hypothetical protein